MHTCPYCKFRFEDEQSLRRHLDEGRGCPDLEDLNLSRIPGLLALLKL